MAAFALNPAQAIEGVIDYSTTEGRKLYNSATSRLDEELFDCNADGLYQFLQSLGHRASEYGWDNINEGIISIPENQVDANPEEYSILTEYGQLTMEMIEEYETTFIDTEGRQAQNTHMLYQCLMRSISKEGKKKILIWQDEYHIDGNKSGTLLLKVIIRESHIDTNATTSNIRTKLSSLDTYIHTIGQDITKLNTHVKLLIGSLQARGETTQDLLTNLFKGYMECSDKEFVGYIKRKHETYEEGNDIEPDALMKLADTKYKILKEAGRWNAPSAEEEKILALEAQIKSLRRPPTKKPEGGKKTDGHKKGDRDKTKNPERPGWFSVEPKEEDLTKPREWNGKPWYWCSAKTGGKCSGAFRRHKPSVCQGLSFFKAKTGEKRKTEEQEPKSTKETKKKVKLSSALQATLDGRDLGDSDDDEK
jgi:hypothetical protein